ncbi:MAG: hypothetical protein M1834_009538 [Cirrosporium novae-zelandiae]|nr:MAG: hypothetical protein M1834_009538 [Cirrosporium novae-zelandiae]
MAQNQHVTKPWYSSITIDLLLHIASYTFLHPFVAWMIPLCLRAQVTPYEHLSMIISIAYASILTAFFFFNLINKRIAYGLPREVDFEEEVIVITGGASGLGLLLAKVYGMRGASIAVLDVKGVNEAETPGVEYYRCDVGDVNQIRQVAKRIEKDLGTPTILINNAGVVNGKPLLSLTTEEVERSFRVNLLAHFHTLQTFLPGMLHKGRGTIVTVSSVLGHLGAARLSDYTAAKAGLIAMHTSLTAELADHPEIKTLLVTPAQLSTDLFRGVQTPSNFFAPVVESTEVVKEIIAAIDNGVSGEISMPLYARWIGLMGILPAGLQKILRWASGVDRAMKSFQGSSTINEYKPCEPESLEESSQSQLWEVTPEKLVWDDEDDSLVKL